MLRRTFCVGVLIALLGGTAERTHAQSPPPTATNDQAAAQHNTPVTIAVLTNDYSSPSPLNPSSVTIVSYPLDGDVTVNPTTGQVTYTPYEGFGGTDDFQYQVANTAGVWSNVATASVTVQGNAAPQIVEFESSMGYGGLWHVDGRVVDENPSALTIRFGGIWAGRTTQVNADGTFHHWEYLEEGSGGLVTAQTTDQYGLDSNIMQDDVGW